MHTMTYNSDYYYVIASITSVMLSTPAMPENRVTTQR